MYLFFVLYPLNSFYLYRYILSYINFELYSLNKIIYLLIYIIIYIIIYMNKIFKLIYILPFLLSSCGSKNEFKNIDQYLKYDPTFIKEGFYNSFSLDTKDNFIKAVDISTLQPIIDSGFNFYNIDGKKENIYSQLKKGGTNTIRLRIFNDPYSIYGLKDRFGTCDLNTIIKIIESSKEYNFDYIIDFHYSDTFADPGHQSIPYAYKDNTLEELIDNISNFTIDTLSKLSKITNNIKYIQLGNEIDNGLLYPFGKPDYNNKYPYKVVSYILDNISNSLKTSEFSNVKKILHFSSGSDFNKTKSLLEQLNPNIDYDILGLSYYPFYEKTNLNEFKKCIKTVVNNTQKDIMLMETSQAFTLKYNKYTSNIYGEEQDNNNDYKASIYNQCKFIYDISNIVKNIDDNRGIGVSYWEPAFIPINYNIKDYKSSWANQGFFTYEGYASPSINIYNYI